MESRHAADAADHANEATPKPPSPWNDATERKLRTLWAEGVSLNGIARAIGGINRNQVVGKVHRLKLPSRPSPLSPDARSWYRTANGKAVNVEGFEAFKADRFREGPVREAPDTGSIETERQRLAAEQAAETERQRLAAEQAAETERQRLAAEQAAETERQRLAAEQAAETERQRLAAEQAAEAERQRAGNRVERLFGGAPILGANLAVQSLRKEQCRWPFGDPRNADFCFCTGRARAGDVYCEDHAKVAYVPPMPRKARAA